MWLTRSYPSELENMREIHPFLNWVFIHFLFRCPPIFTHSICKNETKKHIIPFTPYPSLQPSIPTGSAMSMWTQGQYHLIIWLWCTWQSRLTCLVITVAADGYIKSRTLLWWDKCEWILKLWAQPTWLREFSLLGSIFKENLKKEKKKRKKEKRISFFYFSQITSITDLKSIPSQTLSLPSPGCADSDWK